jgi:hypothetical protein
MSARGGSRRPRLVRTAGDSEFSLDASAERAGGRTATGTGTATGGSRTRCVAALVRTTKGAGAAERQGRRRERRRSRQSATRAARRLDRFARWRIGWPRAPARRPVCCLASPCISADLRVASARSGRHNSTPSSRRERVRARTRTRRAPESHTELGHRRACVLRSVAEQLARNNTDLGDDPASGHARATWTQRRTARPPPSSCCCCCLCRAPGTFRCPSIGLKTAT